MHAEFHKGALFSCSQKLFLNGISFPLVAVCFQTSAIAAGFLRDTDCDSDSDSLSSVSSDSEEEEWENGTPIVERCRKLFDLLESEDPKRQCWIHTNFGLLDVAKLETFSSQDVSVPMILIMVFIWAYWCWTRMTQPELSLLTFGPSEL